MNISDSLNNIYIFDDVYPSHIAHKFYSFIINSYFKLNLNDSESFDYKSFYEYWSEPTKNYKMRKELQKTWETSRRINTWIRNDKNWNTKKASKIDEQMHSYLGALELLEKKYENK